ncbi:MAG TPA: hypothetical protein VFV41_29580 [Streptosporangiaceae bacterium]|nr:hypothetical protein [Streptosporangiaceae bacterium]
MSMLPALMPMMGIHLPASVAPQVTAAAASGARAGGDSIDISPAAAALRLLRRGDRDHG